jgi:ribosomal protein L37E
MTFFYSGAESSSVKLISERLCTVQSRHGYKGVCIWCGFGQIRYANRKSLAKCSQINEIVFLLRVDYTLPFRCAFVCPTIKLFNAEACNIGGQASATSGLSDMKTHIKKEPFNRPLKGRLHSRFLRPILRL